MVNLKANFSITSLEKDFNKFQEDIENDLTVRMIKLGQFLVGEARAKTKSEGGFGNITWNLRGSIGCVVVRDHHIVHSYFPPIKDGTEGNQKGLAYAQEIALLIDDGGIILILVAGMEYAKYVQNRGMDVIDGASVKLQTQFKKLLYNLKK